MSKLRFLIGLLLLSTFNLLNAQNTLQQRIRDSVIGWWPDNRYDKLTPATDPIGKERTLAVNNIVDWVKKSYTPVGSLGSYQRFNNPTSFGVAFDTWGVSSKLDDKGRFKPEGETNITMYIAANMLPGSYPIYFINQPGQAMYVVWQPDGYAATKQFLEKRQGADPRISPNAYPYITRINEWHTVLLVPNNQLPMTPVTKKELLEQAEKGLDTELEKARKEAEKQSPGDTKAIDYTMTYKKQEVDKYRNNIRQLRIKHAASLDEQAVISAMQPTMYSFETDPDIFDLNNWAGQQPLKQYYPVYKLTAELLEQCKAAKPQWIAVFFPYKTAASGNKEYELYLSMTKHINYTYIYHYFFEPAKVKGIPYQPIDAAGLAARLDAYRQKRTQ